MSESVRASYSRSSRTRRAVWLWIVWASLFLWAKRFKPLATKLLAGEVERATRDLKARVNLYEVIHRHFLPRRSTVGQPL